MAGGNAEIDLELKKAFQDLQSQMMETKKKMRVADIQVEIHQQDIKRSQLTKTELLTLPETTPTYQSLGRMFFKQTLKDSVDYMDNTIKERETKVSGIKKHKTLLEKSLKESESNLRDMVQARQANR